MYLKYRTVPSHREIIPIIVQTMIYKLHSLLLFAGNVAKHNDVFGPFPPFPEDAMISRHFQNEAKLTLLQWGVFLDIKNIPAPADSGEER